MTWSGANIQIDLGAEQLIGAQRQREKIAVEVKSFIGGSNLSEFHMALGQYLNYLSVLEETEPERELFLAVTDDVYASFFSQPLGQKQIARFALKLLIYDSEKEEVVQWQP